MYIYFFSIYVLYLVKSSVCIPDRNSEIHYTDRTDGYCKSHQECKNLEYTHCIGHKCVCLTNYERKNYRQCYGGINATCDSDYDCQNEEQVNCIFNICQNYNDFVISNSEKIKHYRATKIGSGCEIDENCQDLRHTVCRSGKCNCASGYWKDDKADICKPVTNATCTYNYDCKEEGTKCLLNRCILPDDFFTESNAVNASLYTAKQPYEFCQTDYHCRNLDNTECYENSCHCAGNSVRYNWLDFNLPVGKEECRVIRNMSCNNDRDCFAGYRTECFLNMCISPEDFFVPSNAHNVSLYAAAGIWGVCRTDHHCRNLENTSCYDNYCQCMSGYFQLSGKCQKFSELLCSRDSDCQPYNGDLYCFENTCQFPSYFFKSHEIKQYRTKWMEDYCEILDNCRNFNNTICYSNKCTCDWEYEYKSGGCRKDPPVDCSKNHTCKPGLHCLDGLCQTPGEFFDFASVETLHLYAADSIFGVCQTDYHCRKLNNTRCVIQRCYCTFEAEPVDHVCQITLNAPCSDDSDCLRAGTRCYVNTCDYARQFFRLADDDELDLYAAKRLYDDCRSDHHCRNLNNTYCFDQTCNCLPGYENVNNNCQKAINVTCSEDPDCLLPRSYCFLNTCLYPEDFFAPSNGYNTSLYAAKRIDGFCQTDHHCREINNSKCFRRKCTCKDDYFPSDNGCIIH